MPQSWDMGQILSLPLRRKAGKIQRLRPGFNPRTRVLEASMLDHRSRPISVLHKNVKLQVTSKRW